MPATKEMIYKIRNRLVALRKRGSGWSIEKYRGNTSDCYWRIEEVNDEMFRMVGFRDRRQISNEWIALSSIDSIDANI